ncbi:MAG: SAM hydrolase/SAM-dependent halogenase family protein [Candidatus Dormibacteria bacterium]
MASILTLLTDFGSDDAYGGTLEGAIAKLAPQLRVVTLTHGVPSHDIGAGAYWLAAAAPAFPPGTVHCVVVDPGVGTDRPLVVARVDRQLVVAPDNGLLHFLWTRGRDRRAVRVDLSPAELDQVSPTFHGRDLIGPLAARLALGEVQFRAVGRRLPSPQLIGELLPHGDAEGTTARVVLVDHFGNVILAVARTPWYSPLPAAVELPGGRVLGQLVQTYAEIDGDCALLWNSAGHLEIAGNQSSAAALLGLGPGDEVRVVWTTATPATERARAGWVAAP